MSFLFSLKWLFFQTPAADKKAYQRKHLCIIYPSLYTLPSVPGSDLVNSFSPQVMTLINAPMQIKAASLYVLDKDRIGSLFVMTSTETHFVLLAKKSVSFGLLKQMMIMFAAHFQSLTGSHTSQHPCWTVSNTLFSFLFLTDKLG